MGIGFTPQSPPCLSLVQPLNCHLIRSLLTTQWKWKMLWRWRAPLKRSSEKNLEKRPTPLYSGRRFVLWGEFWIDSLFSWHGAILSLTLWKVLCTSTMRNLTFPLFSIDSAIFWTILTTSLYKVRHRVTSVRNCSMNFLEPCEFVILVGHTNGKN